MKQWPPDGSVSSKQTNNKPTYCGTAADKTDFEILLLCVTGKDHLICDGQVSARCWNKPWVLLVSFPLFSTRWNLTHWTANAEAKQKGFWKLGAAFVFTTQKSNNGLGSRRPRSHFLCMGTLPLQLLHGWAFTNRQAGHLTTEKFIWKGHVQHLWNPLLWCFLASWQQNCNPPTSRRLHTDPDYSAFIPHMGHIIQPFSKCVSPHYFLFHVIFSPLLLSPGLWACSTTPLNPLKKKESM